jgi:translocation protein SEC62
MSNNSQDKHIQNRKALFQVCFLLEERGLKVNSANLGVERVGYYRGRELKQVFEQNKLEISEIIKNSIDKDIGVKSDHAIGHFYDLYYLFNFRMLHYTIILKADKFEEDIKKKFPKKLKPLPKEEIKGFDDNKLYVLNIERPVSKKSYFYLSLVIFIILFLCTFPIWPLTMKYCIWWVLLITLCTIVNLDLY